MSGLSIREATEADLPAILALLADDVHGATREGDGIDASHPGYRIALQAIAADPNQMLLVAEQGERVIGTMQLRFLPGLSYRGGWKSQIEAVRIASDLRGQGLGREMIGWAIARSRDRGVHLVQLSSSKARGDAHRFYERLGFVASHVGMKLQLEGGH